MKQETVTATEYFNVLKDKKRNITDNELNAIYNNCLKLMDKYVATGQHTGAKKLLFHLDMIEKEHEIVKAGIDTYVYREDVEYYIDNIAEDTVKIIELKRFEREIPDEVIEEYMKVKDLFDEFYVVFTDYTGKEQVKAIKERKDYEVEKDPILFGVLKSEEAETMVSRFYWIGDWEDEYCDLTLDKMVGQYEKFAPKGQVSNIVQTINMPKDLEELREKFNNLDKEIKGDRTDRFVPKNEIEAKVQHENESNFFRKVKTFFSKGE